MDVRMADWCHASDKGIAISQEHHNPKDDVKPDFTNDRVWICFLMRAVLREWDVSCVKPTEGPLDHKGGLCG
jgi:hypothetical protein